MPKSKREKVVNLTKTKKKGKEWKEGLITQVRDCVDKYPTIYVFSYTNMRTDKFKELRTELNDSCRFVLGSNKVLQVALGKTDADEARTNLHLISERLKGFVGLLFTTLSREEVEKIVEGFEHEDFARAGSRASHEFKLQEGPLSNNLGPLQHTIEPMLRKFGLPTRLNKGVVELLADHTVCKENEVLNTHQASILKVFDIKMAVFKLKLLACWEDDKYEDIAEDDGEEGEDLDPFELEDMGGLIGETMVEDA